MTFGALRCVVHSFGAHAAELVEPLGGEVDSGGSSGRFWASDCSSECRYRGRQGAVALQAYIVVANVAAVTLFAELEFPETYRGKGRVVS